MVRIDFTLAIARPSADVFARLIDLDRLPEWQESSMVSSADGPLELGSVVKERRRIMGREFETELEVTSCDAPRQLTLKALGGPVPFTVDHQLVEDDGATLLHVVAEAKTASAGRATFSVKSILTTAGGYPRAGAGSSVGRAGDF